MITTEQFEHKLIEYLDGELSDAEKREVEEYLQAHPEAIDLKGDFSLLCAAGKSIRESTFPADLLLEANRKLAARLDDSRPEDATSTPVASSNGSPEIAPSRTLQANWRRRFRPPVLAAVLAALAILTVGVVTQRAALADIASSLLRIVVTFNDEPLSDSQQQAFDEVVEITETLDENGDPVVTVNMDGDQLFQEFRDGVLEVMVSGDENNEAVSSDLVDSLLTELGADADQAIIVVGPPGAHTAFEISLDEKPIVVENVVNLGSIDSRYAALDVLSPHAHDSLRAALDSLRAAKIGSQSPGVIEDKSWGDIKKAVGSTKDDAP